jgi:hypothetical protein
MSTVDFEAARSRLKKVNTAVSESATAPVICGSSADYDRLMRAAFVENFQDAISDFTFASLSVPLTRETARALLDCRDEDIETDVHLRALVVSLDELAEKLGRPRFFVRLSSRSPKDAPLALPAFKDLLGKCRARIAREHGESNNTRLHALQVAATLAMACKSGRDAVQLLLNSKRIRDDLERFSSGELGDFRVWAREFRFMPIEFELRAFVFERRLTAISQYNEFLFFPHLVAHQDAVRAKASQFVADVMPLLPLDSCVLDLALVRDGDGEDDLFMTRAEAASIDTFRVVIVELNPFAEFMGGGCFRHTDMPLLMGRAGDATTWPVFRLVESAAQVATDLSSDWKE